MWLEIIYFIIPGALANMMPVFVRKINFLDKPVDFGSGMFGSHKTWRGILFAVIGGIIGASISNMIYDVGVPPGKMGLFIALGVMFGDLIGSFIKRIQKIAPGESVFLLDQLDSPIFLVLFLIPIYEMTFELALGIIFVWFFGHIIVRHIGYWLKIIDSKW